MAPHKKNNNSTDPMVPHQTEPKSEPRELGVPMNFAMQRSLIVYFPEARIVDKQPEMGLDLLLKVFGYNAKPKVWIHDINLDRNYVMVMNGAKYPIELTGMYICNEERRNRFDFPDGFTMKPLSSVKVI
jgi:hypothetical protein